uniref:Uncharacterized protein n=1 Tax=Rhizophora mucronata TaxID=61149 RepID=A0A2P2PMJ0_RHIMU
MSQKIEETKSFETVVLAMPNCQVTITHHIPNR